MTNEPISLTLFISICMLGIIFMYLTFIKYLDKAIKLVTGMIAGIIFMLAGMTMFTTDVVIYESGNVHTTNIGWVGMLLVIIGITMVLYTILLIYQIFAAEKELQYYKGHG